MKVCPCSSGKPYIECCERFISGKLLPKTPEQLMRSRYSAYTVFDIDYIGHTMRSVAAKGFDKRETEIWAQQIEWLGLEILNTGEQGHSGFVEFIAKYIKENIPQQIHEYSEFQRKNGRWYYVKGKTPFSIEPLQAGPKIGRNISCPCKSGKKFKKCCAVKKNVKAADA